MFIDVRTPAKTSAVPGWSGNSALCAREEVPLAALTGLRWLLFLWSPRPD